MRPRPILHRLIAAVHAEAPNRVERACSGVASVGLALALAAGIAQAALPAVIADRDALLQAVARATPDAAACADGWAAVQASRTGLTEAELTAWYLRDALALDDADVIAGVGALLSRPTAERGPRAQILLCVAMSRQLTTPGA